MYTWLSDNFLLLNDKKTEIVRFGKQYTKEDIQNGSTYIKTQPCVTSLGFTLDVGYDHAHDSSLLISELLPTLHTEDTQLLISGYM